MISSTYRCCGWSRGTVQVPVHPAEVDAVSGRDLDHLAVVTRIGRPARDEMAELVARDRQRPGARVQTQTPTPASCSAP